MYSAAFVTGIKQNNNSIIKNNNTALTDAFKQVTFKNRRGKIQSLLFV